MHKVFCRLRQGLMLCSLYFLHHWKHFTIRLHNSSTLQSSVCKTSSFWANLTKPHLKRADRYYEQSVNLSLQKAPVISPHWSSQDGSPAPQSLSQRRPPAFPSCTRLPRTSPSRLHNCEGKEIGRDGGVVDGSGVEKEMACRHSLSECLLQQTSPFHLSTANKQLFPGQWTILGHFCDTRWHTIILFPNW